jgi:hypothetical protein
VDRRAGERPEGRIIPAELWDEFDSTVTLSAITFKKNHQRTKGFGGNISIFMQRQKVPPIKSDEWRVSDNPKKDETEDSNDHELPILSTHQNGDRSNTPFCLLSSVFCLLISEK